MSNKTPKVVNAKTESARRKFPLILFTALPVVLVAYALGVLAATAIVWGVLYFGNNNDKIALACSTNPTLSQTNLKIDDTQLTAEIAKTGEEKSQGLSGRNCLDNGAAMLFPYELTGDYCFWMKDMQFPIDMIWLDDDKKIVTIKSNVTPDTYPNTFCPERPAKYIVEVQSGLAGKLGWQSGTQFEF